MPRKKNILPESYNDVFPTRLRRVAEVLELTQQNIADLITENGIKKTRQSIGYYMDGTSSPDWKTLATLGKVLGVSVDFLLGLSDTPSMELSVSEINRLTGLSTQAIIKLKIEKECEDVANPNKIDFLNYLITHNNYGNLIDAVVRKNTYAESPQEFLFDLDVDSLHYIDMEKLLQFIANDEFWKICSGYKRSDG